MQAIEKNLFTQISAEESANVNGGLVSLAAAADFFTVVEGLGLDTSDLSVMGGLFLLLTGDTSEQKYKYEYEHAPKTDSWGGKKIQP